jgi:hypothetical protein
VNANASDKEAPPAAARLVKAWHLSPEEWLAFEADRAGVDDYDCWIAELEEAEAGDATKQNADLMVINTPFGEGA